MAIIKVHKKNRYVVVDNKLARNSKLTLKSKGLMLYLLSLPADKNITVKELEKHTIEGLDALHNAVNELITEGYINKLTYRNEKGLFQTEYTVYEYPQVSNLEGLSTPDKPNRINQSGLSEPDNPVFRSKERFLSKEEKSSSTLSDITLELKEIGLSGNEINELIKEIDDDDKLKIIFEKIELIKIMISTGTVKNPVAYSIKTIKNINFNKPDILKKVEAEKRTQRDKKRKAEKLARIKEQKQYEQDLAMTEAEIPKMRKVIDERLSKFKKLKKAVGGPK